ncbi:MAG TPA: hypothetical protein PLT66_07065, partial [Bacillota bacterium]|nr:hypothetical protein [Bacillota bacterium]
MSGSITVAASAGFCFGVRRAAALIESEAASGGKTLYMLGELIHNRDFNERLSQNGVKMITPDALGAIDPASSLVFIRAHGEHADVMDKLMARSIPFTDATCPYVNKIHQIVSSQQSSDTLCIIIGKADHPEVTATASFCKGETLIAGSAQELEKLLHAENAAGRKIIAVCQTTHSVSDWKICSEYIRSIAPDAG